MQQITKLEVVGSTWFDGCYYLHEKYNEKPVFYNKLNENGGNIIVFDNEHWMITHAYLHEGFLNFTTGFSYSQLPIEENFPIGKWNINNSLNVNSEDKHTTMLYEKLTIYDVSIDNKPAK